MLRFAGRAIDSHLLLNHLPQDSKQGLTQLLPIYYIQATLIGSGGGILEIPPPSTKNLENTPSKFWENFFNNREKLRNLD